MELRKKPNSRTVDAWRNRQRRQTRGLIMHRTFLFRDWCADCVAGCGRDWPRRTKNRDKGLAAPEVHMDY